MTAADGAFSFLDIEEGSYVLTAAADAYETATANVIIRDDSQSSRDVKLTHRSSVRELAAVSRSASSAAEAAGPLASIEDAWRAARAYLLLEYFPRVILELAPAFGDVLGYQDTAMNPARSYAAGELQEIQVERVLAGPVGQACGWYVGAMIRALHEALCASPGQLRVSIISSALEAEVGEERSPIVSLWEAELLRLWSVVNSRASIPAPLPDALTPASVTAEFFPFAAAVECDKP